ncbi:MAG: GNAT family N-acetyltransferase [Acidimicrobiia bacterium]
MAAVPSPLSSYSLRLAEAGDFDAYMDAFEAVAAEGRWMGAEAPLDRDARRAGFDRAVARDDSVLFLADAGGAVVGSIYASLSGGVVDLGMFVVAGHRGGGIGSALLEAVIDWARTQEAHKVSLAVWPTNYPAIGLYARYGFRIEGTRRRHYRRRSGELWEAVWMGLILDHDTAGGPGPTKPPRPSIVVPDGGIRSAAAGGIVLREWHRADIPALVTVIDDPEIRRTLPHIPDPYTTADAEEYIANTRVNLTAGTAIAAAIILDGDVAGSIDLRLGGGDGRMAQMGYWVAAPTRGRGVASNAARLLCDFGFETLGLRRVELNAAVNNPSSCRVAEKAGFEREGVRRAWRRVGGVPTDFALYSRIANPR